MTLTHCCREVRQAGPGLVSPAEEAFPRVATTALVLCVLEAPQAKVPHRDLDHQREHQVRGYPIVACCSSHSHYERENCSKPHSRLVEDLRTATFLLPSATLRYPACPRARVPALACILSHDKRYPIMGTTRTAMVAHDSLHQLCRAQHRMQLPTAMGHLGGHRPHDQPTLLAVLCIARNRCQGRGIDLPAAQIFTGSDCHCEMEVSHQCRRCLRRTRTGAIQIRLAWVI